MTFDMRITDGTTTITLNSGNFGVFDYTPTVPADGAASVSESIALYLKGGTSTARANFQAINRMLLQAREAQANRRTVPIVYLEVRTSSGEDWYRSEIFSGKADLDEDTLDYQYQIGILQCIVSLTREAFWEGALTVIGLRNNNTFGVYETDPVQIWNANDSGKDNFVEYEAESIEGDMPAPLQLTIVNTFDDTRRMDDVYIGLHYRNDPTAFNPVLEAEDATDTYDGATPTLNVNYSGGYFVTLEWDVQTIVDLLTWDLDADFLAACNGDKFRCLVVRDGMTGTQLRVKVTDGITDYYVGDWVTPGAAIKLVELSAVRLPPYSIGLAGVFGLSLVLQARRQQAGTHTETVDFLQLTPTNGYKRLISVGFFTGYGISLVDDAIEGDLYTDGWDTSGKLRNYRSEGQLMLKPNQLGRLYFLWTGYTGDADYMRTATVQVSYRPRRKAL